MSILLPVLVFGMIIFVHELGHFLLAKKNGIGVLEFSLGFGPKLVSFQKGETTYAIKCIPFGGSCMMMDELAEDSYDIIPEKSFRNKSVWARISVIAAGPAFNFLLAFVLAVIVIGTVGIDRPVLSGVMEGFPAQEAGMEAGDRITEINGKKIVVYRDVSLYLALHPQEDLLVTYERDGQTRQVLLTPKYYEETGTYMMGIQVSGLRDKTSVGETLMYSAYEVKYWFDYTLTALRMLVQGQIGVESMTGPVGLVDTMSDMVEESSQDGLLYVFLNLFNFSILLSVNLGVINLLPLPALDGGRIFFFIIELVRGKPIDPEKEGMVHMAGMALLMVLMVVVLYQDIARML